MFSGDSFITMSKKFFLIRFEGVQSFDNLYGIVLIELFDPEAFHGVLLIDVEGHFDAVDVGEVVKAVSMQLSRMREDGEHAAPAGEVADLRRTDRLGAREWWLGRWWPGG